MSENTKELKEKINVFLKREYNEKINGNNSDTNFFKKLYAIMVRRIEEKRDDNSDNDLPALMSSPLTSFKPHKSKFLRLIDEVRTLSSEREWLNLNSSGELLKQKDR